MSRQHSIPVHKVLKSPDEPVVFKCGELTISSKKTYCVKQTRGDRYKITMGHVMYNFLTREWVISDNIEICKKSGVRHGLVTIKTLFEKVIVGEWYISTELDYRATELST